MTAIVAMGVGCSLARSLVLGMTIATEEPRDPTLPRAESSAPDTDGGEDDHTGLQISAHTGLAVPAGQAVRNLSTSDVFSPQVPLVAHVGGKPNPSLYLGAYVGFGLGGAGGHLSDVCESSGAACVALSIGVGLEVQYHLLPAEKANPWFGYGFGYSASTLTGSSNGHSVGEAFDGFDFAHRYFSRRPVLTG